MKILVFSAALILFSVQCRHKMDYPSDVAAFNTKSAERLEVRAKWMKYKGDKIDLGVQIVNAYKQALVLKYQDFTVEMSGDTAVLTSPRGATFEIEPGETMNRELTFRFPAEKDRPGPVKLHIRKIQYGPMEKPGKDVPSIELELPYQP